MVHSSFVILVDVDADSMSTITQIVLTVIANFYTFYAK